MMDRDNGTHTDISQTHTGARQYELDLWARGCYVIISFSMLI